MYVGKQSKANWFLYVYTPLPQNMYVVVYKVYTLLAYSLDKNYSRLKYFVHTTTISFPSSQRQATEYQRGRLHSTCRQ